MSIDIRNTTNVDGLSELNRILNMLNDNVAGDGNAVRVFHGYGTPEGNVAANVGAMYMRLDGASGTTLYIKESGTDASGWVAIDISSVVSLARGGTGQDLSTQNQGDIYYDNGSNAFVRLTPGVSGQYLKTQGASSNPVWGTISQEKPSDSCFSVTTSGNTVGAVTGGVDVAFNFTTEQFDTGSDFNLSTDAFVVPTTGKYLFTFNGDTVSNNLLTGDRHNITVTVSGTGSSGVICKLGIGDGEEGSVAGSIILDLTASDSVTLVLNKSNDAANTCNIATDARWCGTYLP